MTFPFYPDSAAESEISVFESIREGGHRMSRERFSVKQINNHLREAEVLLAQGMTVGEICHHSPAEPSGFRTARLPDARPIPHQPALPSDHGTGRGPADGCDRPAGKPVSQDPQTRPYPRRRRDPRHLVGCQEQRHLRRDHRDVCSWGISRLQN